MKKDRNCGMNPYPVYQPYPQVGPGMVAPNMMPGMVTPNMMPPMMTPGNVQMTPQYTITNQDGVSSNTIEQQMAQMQRQINNLDTRVSKLESSLNTISNSSFNANQYSSGNYHIV